MCDAPTDPPPSSMSWRPALRRRGYRPYVIPVGGSNALGAKLGHVESALEISQQCEDAVAISSVVVASGSAGTYAGLKVGLEQPMPQAELDWGDRVALGR